MKTGEEERRSLESLDKKKDNGKHSCPECGGVVAFEEGCMKCYLCGFSRC